MLDERLLHVEENKTYCRKAQCRDQEKAGDMFARVSQLIKIIFRPSFQWVWEGSLPLVWLGRYPQAFLPLLFRSIHCRC